ncbi:MAG TPA: LytTR family DNA-binding domain-containing protein [Cyclobacteriaceae bacterium]|nr:LytTR family DNA-binding domain-containing protein [Cyclobacteriaceae bacterium]
MNRINCIIVDDEPLAIEIMESYVQKVDQLELKGSFRNAVTAFSYLQSNPVDVIFLDIQMPKLTGIDFLKTLKNPPKVIFTTAYRDYALDGFELEIVDYLLKPIPFDRFLKAIGRVIQQPVQPLSKTVVVSDSTEQPLFFKVDKKMVKVKMSDILYIESIKDYVKVKTHDKEIITQQKIGYLEESLPKHIFLRTHRSFIAAINKIESYSASEIEIGKIQLPIGRNYKNEVLKVLSKNVFTS